MQKFITFAALALTASSHILTDEQIKQHGHEFSLKLKPGCGKLMADVGGRYVAQFKKDYADPKGKPITIGYLAQQNALFNKICKLDLKEETLSCKMTDQEAFLMNVFNTEVVIAFATEMKDQFQNELPGLWSESAMKMSYCTNPFIPAPAQQKEADNLFLF